MAEATEDKGLLQNPLDVKAYVITPPSDDDLSKEEEVPDTPKHQGEIEGILGEKEIGKIGSVAFLVNQIFGPGGMVLPVAFLNCGWVPVTCFNFVVFTISIVGALMLVEAISKIQGNRYFGQRIEFSTLVLSLLPRPIANVSRFCYHFTMIGLNMIAIVLCAQAMDNALVWVFGHTYALQVYPEFKFLGLTEKGPDAMNGLYSGTLYRLGITLGYTIVAFFTMPLGLLTIAGSRNIQIVAFIFTILTIIVFFIHFCFVRNRHGEEVRSHRLAPFESEGNMSLAVTATAASYMYSMYIPTWINEKRPEVSIRRSLWGVTGTASVFYVMVGCACAIAYPYLKKRNVMQYLYENDQTSEFYKVVIIIYTITAVLPGIPINAISVRYNLYVSRVAGRRTSFFFGSCAPFLVAWLFSNRELAVGVLMWGLVLCGGFINLVLPPYLYYKAMDASLKGEIIPLVKDDMLLRSATMGDLFECGLEPCLRGRSGIELETDEDEEQEQLFSEGTINEDAYIFQSETFAWCREHFGKVTLAMTVVCIAMLFYAIYWRLKYEANVDVVDIVNPDHHHHDPEKSI